MLDKKDYEIEQINEIIEGDKWIWVYNNYPDYNKNLVEIMKYLNIRPCISGDFDYYKELYKDYKDYEDNKEHNTYSLSCFRNLLNMILHPITFCVPSM
jgi:hypothetical protein